VSGLTFYCTLWLAGASDLVTLHFDVAFEHQVVALRTLALLGPLVAFPITRQICLGLVERERDELSEGIETGVITRDVSGGYTEVHRPPALGRSETARQLR
jgi:ubiquinol-cytochrome c reductase cytochrome b subunit